MEAHYYVLKQRNPFDLPFDHFSIYNGDKVSLAFSFFTGDPRYYPMGPFFIRQPNNTVFNQARRKIINNVDLRCIAQGWPTPKYSWFKEEYQ